MLIHAAMQHRSLLVVGGFAQSLLNIKKCILFLLNKLLIICL